MSISQKYQLIDDESVFQLDELEGLTKEDVKALKKTYHCLSIIGSQSSGKSTLLNALFGTTFEQLNRKKRVGQTTKGIWYSIDPKNSMMILDVEGSDSNEREQRTKIERRNSLFALAVSHTLLINLWIQQIGLYKGSQLAILEIILELNLRLFGSEQPKSIIFVVRDFCKGRENEAALREKLFLKVEQAWNLIKKPPGKEHIKLSDLFTLEAFFLPSKIDQPEEFYDETKVLNKHLMKQVADIDLISHNIPMSDLPLYMKNLWQTIEADKDINLPEEKILVSNMKCQEVKNTVYSTHEEQFRDELERSQRKMNIDFAINMRDIVNKMLAQYDEGTTEYIKQEVGKVREEFITDLERKIELSYSYQVKHIVDECLREFSDEVNRLFIKDKNIQNIKALKPEAVKKFAGLIQKVSYVDVWADEQILKYEETISAAFKHQKEKIIMDTLKDFDRSIKKQIEAFVSNAFYDRKIFCDKFWDHINTSYKEVQHKAKNSIVSLYNKLDFKNEVKQGQISSNFISEHVERARNNARQQLKTIIEMKCNDLLYYIMRHFSVEFNLDEEEIPRQWPSYKIQQIEELYKKIKEKYTDLLPNFSNYELDEGESMMESSIKLKRMSSVNPKLGEELLKSSEMASLRKKISEQMNNQFQEAKKKNKQVYVGAIPKWAWIIFLIVAFDDIIIWMQSPYMLLPISILVALVAVVFAVGGKGLAGSLVNNARRAATNTFQSFTTQAATRMMRNN